MSGETCPLCHAELLHEDRNHITLLRAYVCTNCYNVLMPAFRIPIFELNEAQMSEEMIHGIQECIEKMQTVGPDQTLLLYRARIDELLREAKNLNEHVDWLEEENDALRKQVTLGPAPEPEANQTAEDILVSGLVHLLEAYKLRKEEKKEVPANDLGGDGED